MSIRDRVSGSLFLVVALVIGLIIVASVMPVAFNSFFADDSNTLTQVEDQTYNVAGLIDTNATDVDASGATIELNRSGTTESNTVSTSSTTTYTLDGHDVNVTVDSVDTAPSTNETTVTYEYSPDAAWDDNTGSLYFLVPLFVIIGLVIAFLIKSLDWM